MSENPDEYVDNMKLCEHVWIEKKEKNLHWAILFTEMCVKCRKVISEQTRVTDLRWRGEDANS